MNLPVPPRGSYKAFLFDYDSLLSYSDEECCFSLSEREIQILLAQLDYIGWKSRYKPTATEIDQPTINQWHGNLARKLMSGCCPDDGSIGRFGTDGQWETSDDGGTTWEPNPEDDPRNGYIGAPPLPGADSTAKKCAAADNVESLFTEYRDNLIDMLTAGTPLIAVVSGILAFLAAITGVSGVAIGLSVLFMGLASALLTLTPEEVAEQIDATALDTFKCLVYCRMENSGQITYDNWLLLLADIAEEFTGFPETFFYQTVNGMGYIGISNAGTVGAATASDCEECDCDPPNCLDKFEVFYGEFLGVFDGYYRYQSVIAPGNGLYTIGIGTNETEECCELLDFRQVGTDDYNRLGRIQCGDTAISYNWTLSSCNHYYFADTNAGPNDPFILEILLAECD